MTINVQRIELWHKEVVNRPGVLASVLKPLADAGADLEMIMATSFPGDSGLASVGVFPVTGPEVTAAALAEGLHTMPAMSALLVTGDNKAGFGRELAQTIAAAGINIGLVVILVVGNSFSAVFGFENEADAVKAAELLKNVAPPGKRTRVKKEAAAKAKNA